MASNGAMSPGSVESSESFQSAAMRALTCQCEQVFWSFDTDSSGTLTYEELVPCMQAMHAKAGFLEPSSQKVQKALAKYDTNHDGVLDLSEFMELFSHIMLKAQKPQLPPQLQAMKKQSLQLFDQVATDGKLGKQDFVSIMTTMLKPLLAMPVQQLSSSQGPCGPFGPDLRPAFERAVQAFDFSGLEQLLRLVHETIDADRNGTLEREEVKKLWDLIAAASDRSSPDDLANLLWLLLDKDGDGKISLEETTGLLEKLLNMVGALTIAVLTVLDNVITSSEIEAAGAKLLAMTPLMAADTNNDGVISRSEFKSFMEQTGVAQQVAAMIQQLQTAASQQPAAFKALKDMRQALATGEKKFFTKLCLKAKEWKDGGIDEATFLINTIPIMKDALNQPVDLRQAQQAVQKFQASLGLVKEDVANAFQNNKEIQDIQKRVLELWNQKTVEFVPDICRNLFRLLDLDKSGKISARELNILKALMDGVLRLGTSTFLGTSAEALTEEELSQLKELYPDLFTNEAPTFTQEVTALLLAIFDTMDRNGDESLQLEEVVGFLTSLISFVANGMKIQVGVMVQTYIALEHEMLQSLWKNLKITEVSKDNYQDVGMSIMMLAASVTPQPQEGM